MTESVLDAFFGQPAQSPDEDAQKWIAKAKSEGPRVWYYRRNPITQRIVETLSQDTYLPIGGEAGKQLFSVAGDLCKEFWGEADLILQAIEHCRASERWRALAEESIYAAKPAIVQAGHRLKAKQRPDSESFDDMFDRIARQERDKWVARNQKAMLG